MDVDAGLQKVTLFAFNDFHRKLDPLQDGSGGAARLVGKLRQLKQENPDSLILNMGDVAGDNKEHGKDAFEPIPALFNRAQVDALSLGNHEFEDPSGNYKTLRESLIKPLHGEVLCANVSETATGKPVEGTRPFSIKQLAGYNIALIGVVTRDLGSKMFPLAGAGLSVTPIEETLAKMVPEMHDRADAVVVMGHENLRTMTEHTQNIPGIDIGLAAHDHKLTRNSVEVERPDGSKGYVSEAGAYGQNINQIDLYFSPASRKLMKVEMTTHQVDASSPSDPIAEGIVRDAPKLKAAPLPPKESRSKGVRLERFAALATWVTTQSQKEEAALS